MLNCLKYRLKNFYNVKIKYNYAGNSDCLNNNLSSGLGMYRPIWKSWKEKASKRAEVNIELQAVYTIAILEIVFNEDKIESEKMF